MLGPAETQEPTLQVDAWVNLSSVSLQLARIVEQLAPFGAGNQQIALATHGLALESVREMGSAKEHRRLVVVDEEGAKQEVLWWSGGRETLPEAFAKPGSRFDLAYSLRANSFRGEPRIALELIDYQIVREAPVEIGGFRPKVVDMRNRAAKLSDLGPRILVWAEGADKGKGSDRVHLRQADELAIWTPPPSPAELRVALTTVRPRTIYLFAAVPDPEKAEAFLERLAGMVKFTFHQRSGRTRLNELAAATAQAEITVRLGLEWLAAGGHLKIEDNSGELQLSPESDIPNKYLQAELYIAITGVLEETTAYRQHFIRAEAETLFPT